MVRAILDGRKTQTRRVVKLHGNDGLQSDHSRWRFCEFHDDPRREVWQHSSDIQRVITETCPYGVPGDRLYMKEATWLWCERRPNGTTKTGRQKWHYVPVLNTPPVYVADHPTKPDWGYPVTTRSGNVQMWKYKTARFMPRLASRITLEIAEVRVQRVQEISNMDARAEGVDCAPHRGGTCGMADTGINQCAICPFRSLWDSINAKRGHGWDKNDWVWAITFKRVQ